MSRPTLRVGQIVRWAYQWRDDHLAERHEGAKDRPCMILRIVETDNPADPALLLLPITHAPPRSGKAALELPAREAGNAGLDDRRSWLILDEGNVGRAQSYNLTPVRAGQWTYGALSYALFRAAEREANDLMQAGRFDHRVPGREHSGPERER